MHGVIHDGIVRDRSIQLVRQSCGIVGQILIPKYGNRKMLELAERNHCKQI